LATLPYDTLPRAAGRDAATTRPIAWWLLFCCAMVFAMAVIGAVTRLTESGLSMVEWRPLVGVLPPLSEAEWNRVFDLYRESPEYRLVNRGMSLEEFRYIFYWEWFHRLWGHLIGVAFAVPLAWFALRRRIPAGLGPKLLGLLALGALQGFVGWFMVASGLVDRPSVSHYRLAMHLALAFLIYALMLWVALGLLGGGGTGIGEERARRLRVHGGLALAFAGVTMVWGAFVAGLDAGMIHQDWPLMSGRFVPSEAWHLQPAWLNLFENHATVQFFHRWIAIAAGLLVLSFAWRAGRGAERRVRLPALLLAVMTVVQISLGIATLHTGVAIPVAAAHQAGALGLLTFLVWLLSELRRPETGR
jgi:cytochrome c oxidase assembly protein subunit 15